MSWLADSNILLYWLQPAIPQRTLAVRAVQILHGRGEAIYLIPQNVVEFWSGATRPLHANPPGLGLTTAQADVELRLLTGFFPVLFDVPVIYDEWLRLVTTYNVMGAQVHDARIAAAMRMHGITHILTFNPTDFRRYPGITAVHPHDV